MIGNWLFSVNFLTFLTALQVHVLMKLDLTVAESLTLDPRKADFRATRKYDVSVKEKYQNDFFISRCVLSLPRCILSHG